MMIPNCSIPDCDGQAKARGWCWRHLQRWYRHGDALYEPPPRVFKPKRIRPTWVQRIFAYVRITDDCWLWLGSTTPQGYARAWSGRGRVEYVHRMVYELCVGPIPDGLTINHLCRVRHCIHPEHLDVVSLQTNVLRSPIAQAAMNAAKTHCKWGHPFSSENTYRPPNHPRSRVCRTCVIAKNAACYRRKKEQRAA